MRNPPEATPDGVLQSAVSQSLPTPTREECMGCNYVLGDFGNGELYQNTIVSSHNSLAQPLGRHTIQADTVLYNRAPEVQLCGPWAGKADIWSFGCLEGKDSRHFNVF